VNCKGAMNIQEYTEAYNEEVIRLIVSIQHDELGVNITADDQPDLKAIPSVYQKGNGNFWVASDGQKLVGTIALIDIGGNEGALRKMFVHREYRGRDKGIAQQLMDILFNWGRNRQMKTIYLGTIDIMKAAHRFYEKNGFQRIDKKELPVSFQAMPVDNVFYKFSFITKA
jgi:N-acetylglutamate synthase-like GNAT family acetyltransferase